MAIQQAHLEKQHTVDVACFRDPNNTSAPRYGGAQSGAKKGSNKRSEMSCRIGALLLPGFSLDEYALFVSALENANTQESLKSFQIQILSERGGVICGSLQSAVETEALNVCDLDYDFFFVFSEADAKFRNLLRLRAYLARLRRQKCTIGAIGGSVVALAMLDLIEQNELAVHWRQKELLNELSPLHTSSDKLCESTGSFWSCCGRTSALDLALSLIAKAGCASTAVLVAQEFVHSRTYNQQATWDKDILRVPVTGSRTVNRALEVFQQNLEQPLHIRQVAKLIGVSQRQLERQFGAYCGMSPGKKYKDLRLSQARNFVVRTNLSITEISVITGFASVSGMAASYRKKYNTTPTYDRRKLRFG